LHTPLFLQGFGLQSFKFVSQSFPEYPRGQLHLYPLTKSSQIAPFLQGLQAQSSVLISQFLPS